MNKNIFRLRKGPYKTSFKQDGLDNELDRLDRLKFLNSLRDGIIFLIVAILMILTWVVFYW